MGKYDIVFVDYANGTDDILLNAGLFEQVLNWVNTHKASTEQNVVLGMSMGGLIGRYKLAELEQANPGSTQVRLLVLQDSPQRGANVPLGILAALQQFNNTYFSSIGYKDLNIVVQEAIALLNQPGTRQLLKYQALGPNDSDFFANTFIDGPYRQKVAYAAPYRIVAVSQGAQCGEVLYAPYTEIVNASGSSFNGLLGFLAQGVVPLPGFGGECIINALPTGSQSERVSGLYIYHRSYLLGIPIRFDITRQNFHCPAGLLPLDGGAGGTEPFVGGPDVLNGSRNPDSGFLGSLLSYQYTAQTRFCFVPTASALDIDNFSVPALSGKYINNTASVGTSRTSSFLAQQSFQQNGAPYFNQPHLLFTARNGEWMYNEMERPFFVPTPTKPTANPRACDATGCDATANKTITGPLTLCTGSSGPATYTSPIQGPGYTYTWAASPASAFTVASGSGPTFQTANVPGVNATGTLTLTVNTGCEFTFSKEVAVGRPARVELQEDLDASDPCMKISWFNILNYDPSLAYSSTGTLGGVGSGRFRVKGRPGSSGAAFTITVTNACGSVSTSSVASFPDCGYRYEAYPNPADDQLTVEQTDSTGTQRTAAARGTAAAASSSAAPGPPYTVRLFDSYGVQQAQQATTAPTLSLPTGALPTGLYLLHIEVNGAVVERRRLQITH